MSEIDRFADLLAHDITVEAMFDAWEASEEGDEEERRRFSLESAILAWKKARHDAQEAGMRVIWVNVNDSTPSESEVMAARQWLRHPAVLCPFERIFEHSLEAQVRETRLKTQLGRLLTRARDVLQMRGHTLDGVCDACIAEDSLEGAIADCEEG